MSLPLLFFNISSNIHCKSPGGNEQYTISLFKSTFSFSDWFFFEKTYLGARIAKDCKPNIMAKQEHFRNLITAKTEL